MKVKIGKYRSYFGVYQLTRMFTPIITEDFADTVAEFLTDSWLDQLLLWIDSKRNRKVKIVIDDFDTWNLDHTLALIIGAALKKFRKSYIRYQITEDDEINPALKKFKKSYIGGYQIIGNDEVPVELHTDSDPYTGHISEEEETKYVAKWKYIIDEMIWSFDYILDDDKIETQEGEDRCHNGLRLFAKYYRGLWD